MIIRTTSSKDYPYYSLDNHPLWLITPRIRNVWIALLLQDDNWEFDMAALQRTYTEQWRETLSYEKLSEIIERLTGNDKPMLPVIDDAGIVRDYIIFDCIPTKEQMEKAVDRYNRSNYFKAAMPS